MFHCILRYAIIQYYRLVYLLLIRPRHMTTMTDECVCRVVESEPTLCTSQHLQTKHVRGGNRSTTRGNSPYKYTLLILLIFIKVLTILGLAASEIENNFFQRKSHVGQSRPCIRDHNLILWHIMLLHYL